MLKHRPFPSTPPHLVRVLALTLPSLVKVEPTGQHQVGLFSQRIPIRVSELKLPFVVEGDLERTVVHVAVTGDADSEEVVGQSRTALRVRDEMMQVKPDFMGAARRRTTPTLPTKNLPLLSLGGVPVARIEAESFVFDR